MKLNNNDYCFPSYDTNQIKEAFDCFDINRNGYIGVSELKEIFSILGEDVTHEEMDEMIHLADKEGDGQVNWLNFYEFITGNAMNNDIRKIMLENKNNDYNAYDEEVGWNEYKYDSNKKYNIVGEIDRNDKNKKIMTEQKEKNEMMSNSEKEPEMSSVVNIHIKRAKILQETKVLSNSGFKEEKEDFDNNNINNINNDKEQDNANNTENEDNFIKEMLRKQRENKEKINDIEIKGNTIVLESKETMKEGVNIIEINDMENQRPKKWILKEKIFKPISSDDEEDIDKVKNEEEDVSWMKQNLQSWNQQLFKTGKVQQPQTKRTDLWGVNQEQITKDEPFLKISTIHNDKSSKESKDKQDSKVSNNSKVSKWSNETQEKKSEKSKGSNENHRSRSKEYKFTLSDERQGKESKKSQSSNDAQGGKSNERKNTENNSIEPMNIYVANKSKSNNSQKSSNRLSNEVKQQESEGGKIIIMQPKIVSFDEKEDCKDEENWSKIDLKDEIEKYDNNNKNVNWESKVEDVKKSDEIKELSSVNDGGEDKESNIQSEFSSSDSNKT